MKLIRMKLLAILAFALVMAMVVASPVPVVAYASDPITVTVDGQEVNFQYQDPIMVNSRIFVPVREVFELMGFNVAWDPQERIAILAGDSMHIIIPADSESFYVNGEVVIPDAPQKMLAGRLMLPLRAVAEAAGGVANWDPTNRVAKITTEMPPVGYVDILTAKWVYDGEFYTDVDINLIFILYPDGHAVIGVEGSAVVEYEYWYVSDDGLLVIVHTNGERFSYKFTVDAYALVLESVDFAGSTVIFNRYHGSTTLSTPHQAAQWPHQYNIWIRAVYSLFYLDWNDFIWVTPMLDAMIADGVDHNIIGNF